MFNKVKRNEIRSVLRRVTCLFFAALLPTACVSTQQNKRTNINLSGVLIRSEISASYLPVFIVPPISFQNETVEVFARYLENSVFGNAQWIDRKRHIKVIYEPDVQFEVFSLTSKSNLSALELLTMVASETHTLIVVDDWQILIKKAATHCRP